MKHKDNLFERVGYIKEMKGIEIKIINNLMMKYLRLNRIIIRMEK
jgi:hypothetical protein